MGISSDGILIFGIDLEEELPESWTELMGEDGGFEFDEYIATKGGMPYVSGMSDEYRKGRDKLIDACPVDLTWHCSYDYPMFILNIRGYTYRAWRGSPRVINESELIVPKDKIEAAKVWCGNNDVEWKEPEWLLCSMYG